MSEIDENVVRSFGERAVGLAFNPSGNELVDKIKRQSAELVNTLNDLRGLSGSPEVRRMSSIAITELQTAQMWGVKAATWKD